MSRDERLHLAMGYLTHQKGVTLIELLITMVIGSIAMMALAMPFIAERSFWSSAQAQSEAQRDAQMALRAIARAAREGSNPSVPPGVTSDTLTFDAPCGATVSFWGGPAFGGQLQMLDNCTGVSSTLIDGARSRVTNLVFTGMSDRLVRIQLEVLHRNRQNEMLETELFLRNAS